MDKNLGLIENNGKVVVSSRDIARVFEKQHAHVMRDIRQIVNDDPTWGLSNFGESSYLNEQRKEQPEFYLTRDGFTLLVMGYTGERAMEFKNRRALPVKQEVEQFFSSDWFGVLTKLDPEMLISRLCKEVA